MTPRTCRACGSPLLWALTVNAKLMPLDPSPGPEGNQAAYRDGTGGWRTRQLRQGEEPLRWEKRYMPHVATCLKPQAAALAPLRRVLPPNFIPITAARSRRAGRNRR